MKTIIICGDRNGDYNYFYSKIKDVLIKYKDYMLINGGCKGIDSYSTQIAKELNIPVKIYYADWKKYGKGAGPIRNREMLKENPEIVIAFHQDINNSKGTLDMLNISKKNNIKTLLIE